MTTLHVVTLRIHSLPQLWVSCHLHNIQLLCLGNGLPTVLPLTLVKGTRLIYAPCRHILTTVLLNFPFEIIDYVNKADSLTFPRDKDDRKWEHDLLLNIFFYLLSASLILYSR